MELERSSTTVLGCSDWTQRVDRCLSEHLGRHRGYRGASVRDLLRAMRNKRHHYGDLPDSSKRLLGSVPEGFEAYFSTRFPRLLLHVFRILGATRDFGQSPCFDRILVRRESSKSSYTYPFFYHPNTHSSTHIIYKLCACMHLLYNHWKYRSEMQTNRTVQ